MTKMCKTCMAREADPSEYHDDACPVFQEQAAYRVGFDAGRRAGIEAAASAVARIANGVPRSIESVRLLTLTADAIRALAAAPDASPEARTGGACACGRVTLDWFTGCHSIMTKEGEQFISTNHRRERCDREIVPVDGTGDARGTRGAT